MSATRDVIRVRRAAVPRGESVDRCNFLARWLTSEAEKSAFYARRDTARSAATIAINHRTGGDRTLAARTNDRLSIDEPRPVIAARLIHACKSESNSCGFLWSELRHKSTLITEN